MEGILSLLNKRKTPHSPFQETSRPSTPPNPQAHTNTDTGPSENTPIPSFPDGVKVLHDCADAIVDICFVHGLTGDRESTWTAEGQSTPWPKTLLPPKLEKARILTYGYDAYIVRKGVASSNRLIDHATNLLNDLTTDRACCNAPSRPIIFVVHSLGGLVCKQAILLSRNNPEIHLRGIFDCTIGIVFMGTPHRGAWMADWAKIPASALGLVKSVNRSLLEILQTNNQALELIQVNFWSMIRERQKANQPPDVTCFFEELPLPGVGKVVSKESATIEGYNPVTIHANHRDMVKFASAEENGFKRVLGELVRWVSQFDQVLSETAQDCLKSLAFPQMQNRSHDISSAVEGTCEWLLQHETYQSWAACDRGLLWIKGKPGSGKSTLLKHALYKHKTRDDALILSFFFHGRGDELQKTPLGLWRSLLHQILRKAPGALQDLIDEFGTKRKQIGEPGEKWNWHEEELWSFFKSSLSKILITRPVWVFIDALDECGKKNAVKLVQIFKSLLQSLLSQSTNLRQCCICFSCRNYPILDRDTSMFEIRTEDENQRDISTFVDGQLAAFCSPTLSRIPALITERASGIFMWARLVVEQVLDLEREGAGVKTIERAIHSIPPDLDELYRQLIQIMEPASQKLIQWICFATRPLSIDELRWAMVVEADCPHRSLEACRSAEDYIPDINRMKRQVQTLSRGLAEVSHTQVVQFIHQSVKDFFVEKGLSALDGNVTSTEAAIRAHFRFSKICIRYLAMEEIGCSTSYDDFAFLHYATTSWVAHAQHTDQISTVIDVMDDHGQTPLSWAARNGCEAVGHEAVVRILLAAGAAVDMKDRYNGQTPLSRAAQEGREAFVQILLDAGAAVDTKDGHGQTPLSRAAEEDGYGWTPLSRAARNNHGAIVRLLQCQ
ncbi:vegetative incompatibility protein HET-E-1 [Dichotomopilus funicola]|uniref:Vegetative incompatibility protein HET-E-1 n=1 Tax=Dichotomopilus funicola TaxID=1934379 RepID=A0AAN6UZV5_9PEZI|nr:vegetative incompatibility protein HET-E-1 [Dichotomopilus funicola]